MNSHVKKTVPIEYRWVEAAYRKVKQGGKAVGIDKESWASFEQNLEGNLYVIWNRLASGSYHPQAVREAEIEKKDGKKRKLGIPTLRDRIAQKVVKDYMENKIDMKFHENSYGYRPLKSAHQAIGKVRENCFQYAWVIDLDIKNFFDEIDHELMLKAVSHIMEERWVKMYVERWLKMPMAKRDGTIELKEGKGTPQGGVISPLLANLYLHYTLDVWLERKYPTLSFVRYADDIIIHCNSKTEAEKVLEAIKERLTKVKLQVNEEKTKIVYCKNYKRKENHEEVQFEFLGFSYQPRARKSKIDGKNFTAFAAEISQSNQKRIRAEIKREKIWKITQIEIEEIAKHFESRLRGWIGYYGKYSKKKLREVLSKIDLKLINWIKRKYKLRYRAASRKLNQIKRSNPGMFYHWQMGYR
ncbi:MAG: group II intron reverse transcriptase/maturase [Ignavibacteria bacterium]|jgi:group II intron reverse transcriptase/maturase